MVILNLEDLIYMFNILTNTSKEGVNFSYSEFNFIKEVLLL